LQEATFNSPNTVCSSAWANRTKSPAYQSTVLALLVTKQFSAKYARNRRAAQKRQKSERSSS
jgi:type I restriction-modification system DNA methylase subunit